MKILSRLRLTTKKLLARSIKNQAVQKKPRFDFTIEEIEARILYSADNPFALVVNHVLPATAVVRLEEQPESSVINSIEVNLTKTLVVVDSRVQHSDQLLADLQKSHQLGLIELVVIDQRTDALQAIGDRLNQNAGEDRGLKVDRILILSHGSQGSLALGDRDIDLAQLRDRQATLSQWSNGLSQGADILLFGCEVGSGETGQQFTQLLATSTKADVAASTDLSGDASSGGNWILERTVGDVQTIVDLTPDWVGLLTTRTVTTSADSGAGSLRQAIIDANAAGPGDSIVFALASNNLVIAPVTALPTITSALTIDGTSAGSKVQISGSLAGVADGLTFQNVTDAGTAVRNIVIRNFVNGTGIVIIGSNSVLVENSFIGSDITGQVAAGNRDGIRIESSSFSNIRNNTIAFNVKDGVFMLGSGTGNTVIQNALFANGLLGINLSMNGLQDGVNSNDLLDTDVGINNLRNSANVLRVYSANGNDNVDFDFFGAANESLRFDFYWSSPSDANAAHHWMGSVNGVTDNLGLAFGTFVAPTSAPTGSVIRIIVTGSDGSSSELSNALVMGQAAQINGLAPTSIGYTENGLSIAIASAVVVTPTSSQLIYSTEIKVTGNYQSGADQLSFTNTANLTGVWDSATGLLKFVAASPTGGVQFEEVQTALRSVRYANSSDDPTSLTRTVTITLSDQYSLASSSVLLSVTPVNDVPIVTLGSPNTSYTEQAPALLVLNASSLIDVDSLTMTGAEITISAGLDTGDTLWFTPANGITGVFASGVLTLSGTASTASYAQALNSIVFSNLSNDNPVLNAKTLSITVNDGTAWSTAATRSFSVIAVNDVPVLVNSSGFTVAEGATQVIGISNLTWTDPDSATSSIVYTVSQAPTNGFLALSSAPLVVIASFTQANVSLNQLIYVHSGNELASDSFRYTVSDGTAPASAAQTITITVIPVNDVPVVTLGSPNTSYTEQAPALLVLNASTLIDVDSVTITGAEITISAGLDTGDTLWFTPANGITGVYASGVLTLSGTASTASYAQALNSIVFSNLSNDNPVLNGKTLSVRVNDGTAWSTAATRSFGVIAVNDAPVLVNSSGFTLVEGATKILDTTNLNWTDADTLASSVTYTVTQAPANGFLAFSSAPSVAITSFTQANVSLNQVIYVHLGNELASDSFRYTVRDGTAPASAAQTIAIVVTPVNDAPVRIASAGFTIAEGAVRSITVLDLNWVDADNPSTNVTYTVTLAPVHGFLALNTAPTIAITSFTQATVASGQLIYVHSGGELPNDSFKYTVSDGIAPASPVQTISIVLTPVNDLPVVTLGSTNSSYTEQAPALLVLNASTLIDVDSTTMRGAQITISSGFDVGDTLGFTSVGGITGSFVGGVLTLSGTTSTANYAQALNSILFSNLSNDNPLNNAKTLSVRVNDGISWSLVATRNFSVVPVNDAPILVSSTGFTVTEGATQTISVSSLSWTDADSSATSLTFTLTQVPANGFLALNAAPTIAITSFTQANIASGQLIYVHSGNELPTDSFKYTVTDGFAPSSAVQTIVISVTPVDDIPIISTPPSAIFIEDSGVITPFSTLTVSDPDTPSYQNASIQIASNYELGFDQFSFANTANITGNWDVTTGKLTLTSLAGVSLAQLQSALRNVTFENTSNTPSTAVRSILLSINDGALTTSISTSLSVVATNDAPVLSSQNPVAVAQGALVALNATNLQLSDADSSNGTLSFNVVTAPLWGRFELNTNPGVAISSFTKLQLLAGEVFYKNLGAAQANDSFVIKGSDGIAATANLTVNIQITLASNPLLILGSGPVAFVENVAAVAIAPNIVISDVGGNSLNKAVITITGNFQAAEDQLLFTDQQGITGTISGNTLTLNGVASLENYQAAIRSIQFLDTSDTPFTATRSVAIVAFNGATSSNVIDQSIGVTATNDAPTVLIAQNFTIVEGANLTLTSSLLNSFDPDNPPSQITYRIVTAPVNGVIAFSSAPTVSITNFTQEDINNGLVRYTHSGLENTSDNFSFQVGDSIAPYGAAIAVSISVTPVNDPASINLSGTTSVYVEQAPGLAIFNTSTISDPDSLTLAGALVKITSSPGTDLLTFVNQAGITGVWDGAARSLTLTGTATIAQYQDAVRSILFSNSSDRPNLVKSFSVELNDGFAVGPVSNLSITVTPVNDAPVVGGLLSTVVLEGSTSTLSSAAINAFDPDFPRENTLIFSLLSNPIYGRLEFIGAPNISITSFTLAQVKAGEILYIHDGSEVSNDSFAFTLSDGNIATAPQTFSISVTNVDDIPIVTASASLNYVEDGAAVAVFRNLSIVDPDTPSYDGAIIGISANFVANKDLLTWNPVVGLNVTWNATTGFLTVSGTASAATYSNFLQSIKFSSAEQNSTTVSRDIYFSLQSTSPNTASLSQTVAFVSVNDAPRFTSVPTSLTLAEDQTILLNGANLIAITDDDLNTGLISVQLQVGFGQITLSPTTGINFVTGNFGPNSTVEFFGSIANVNAALSGLSYVSNANYFGSDSLKIRLNDNGGTGLGGPQSFNTTVPITITAINDTPTVVVNTGAFVAEGGIVSIDASVLRFSDPEQSDSQLTFTLASALAHGYLALNGAPSVAITTFTMQQIAAGLVNYHHDGSQTTFDTFNFRVSDGFASTAVMRFDIQVAGVNDAPQIVVPAIVQITEGINFSFSGTDRIRIADPDAGSAIVEVNLKLNFGSFSLLRTTGLTFSSGDGTSDVTMTFRGSLSAINAAIDGLMVESDPAWTVGPRLTILVNDLGNSGSGGAKSASANVDLHLNLVDDTPILTLLGNLTVAEAQSQVLTPALLNVVDTDTPLSAIQFKDRKSVV